MKKCSHALKAKNQERRHHNIKNCLTFSSATRQRSKHYRLLNYTFKVHLMHSSSGHPMPPNTTLVSVMYNSRRRNEVDLEWKVESQEGGGLTGFILEHVWLSERPGRRDSGNASREERAERIGPPVWYRSIIQDPEARSHTVGSLTPTVSYQFRITSVNHRTVGHASAAKTPGTRSTETF